MFNCNSKYTSGYFENLFSRRLAAQSYNRNTRTRCEVYSKLTIKTPKCSGVFIVNFEHI